MSECPPIEVVADWQGLEQPSSVYDLNPQPYGAGLALNIDEASNACDLDLARSVGPYFRLSETKQAAIIQEVQQAVSHWQDLVSARRIPRSEIEMLRPAFIHS